MRWIAGLLLASLAMPASAGDPSLGDVIAVATHDWNGDGGFDRAVVTGSGDEVDLWLYLSNGEPDGRDLIARAAGIGWRGLMWGTQPEIEVTGKGALLLTTMNEGIGRSRWHETLTILWRDGRFVVGGYTRSAYDTLEPDYEYACDVNLFTGKGVFNGKPIATEVRAVPVTDWRASDAQPYSTRICPEG